MAVSPALRSVTPLAATRRVGRYELLAELGRGGMASVFLARSFGSAGFERLAAVKLLHRGLCADPDFVEMFLDEARVAARLHHPNATAIIDLGAEGQQLYMVMDYVEGDTLYAVQCAASSLRRAVPLGIALRIVTDALAGLDAAHELKGSDGVALGLIHRDVTPHNILVGVDGAARLVDFGIARAANRTGITTVGVLKGKLPFMSPEQIRGRAVDRRADVFSMGVTLWETFALRRCFPSREGAALSRLANEAYRPLHELSSHIPVALDDVCRRALAFDPAERFASAAEFAEALDAAFRADLASQRELGQFMSVVAADKLRVEREAVRASAPVTKGRSMPPPPRPSRPPRPAPVLDLRPPAPPSVAALAARNAILDEFNGFEDVTSLAPSVQPPGFSEKPRAAISLPPLPARSERPSAAAPRPDGSLYEVATQAFALQRPRPSVVPPAPVAQKAPVASRSFFPEPGEVIETATATAVHVAEPPPPAVESTVESAAAPVAQAMPELVVPPPVEAPPAVEAAKEPAAPRGLFARLWAWLRG